jgi:hypothetical protein
MRTVILTESQLKKVIDGVISEQNESRTESITVNFGALWPMGKWKLTQQQTSQISDELVKIVNFINQNKGSKITIQLEAGESQVTNKDNEVTPATPLQPGALSQKRGESLKVFLDNYFKSLVGKTISQNELPEIPEPKTIIGQTSYSGPKDLQDKTKVAQYQSEQFVRAVISAQKNYECIVGLEITIGYYDGKNKAGHTCDEAIFELRMNGVSLGVVNLNNSSLDMGYDYVMKRYKIDQESYKKRVSNFERLLAAGVYKERERKQILPSEEPSVKWPLAFTRKATQMGYETVEQFVDELNRINDSFKEYGRKSDGKSGGNRSQTFTLTGAQAKGIIDNSPSDKIVLSIIPLVSKDGKYKIFYQTGTHADTPWVTIINRKVDKTLYDGEPNIGMKRGSTQETVLLTTDLCGNPIQKQ